MSKMPKEKSRKSGIFLLMWRWAESNRRAKESLIYFYKT